MKKIVKLSTLLMVFILLAEIMGAQRIAYAKKSTESKETVDVVQDVTESADTSEAAETAAENQDTIAEAEAKKLSEDRISFEGIEYRILKEPKGKKKGRLSAECFVGKSVKKVVFPETVNCEGKSYIITEIAPYAFDETKVLSVTLNSKMTEIGAGAFAYAAKLTELIVPACEKLKIGDGAFYGCELLAEMKLDSGAAVTSIGEAAFVNTALKKVVLPESCRTIGASAFYGCKALKKAVLGRGVESIGAGAFKKCNKKLKLSFSGDNPYLRFVDGCLYSVEDGSLLNGDAASGNLVLQDGLTTIPAYCFEGNEALKTVIIPESVTSIGEGVFMDCVNLTSVVLPEGLQAIEAFSFYNCKKLKALTIPKSVEMIDQNPFMYCPKLTGLAVEEGNSHFRIVKGMLCSYNKKTIISAPAVKGTVKLYSSARYIAPFAFCGNTAIKKITLNKKLKSVGMAAFYDCSSLGYVYVPNEKIDFTVDAWVADEDDTEFCGIFSGCKKGLEINIPYNLNSGSSDSIDFFIRQHCDDDAIITQR